jgi:ribosomal protein S18 acetylase RimI-like enzyme
MWRPMQSRDLKKVHEISLIQWGSNYYESLDTFKNKLEFYPEGCFVYEADRKICGYLISHVWEMDNVPVLNAPLHNPTQLDVYYIHDIVLIPEYRGNKIAHKIIQEILDSKPRVTLVAPEPTQYYWKKYYGFEKTAIKTRVGIYMRRI